MQATDDRLISFHRSAVDFSDPAFRRAAMPMSKSHMCAYLMAMAAWQRGLRVEFFGSQAAARVNMPRMPKTADTPRLYSVSDGARSHFFFRSGGDLSSVDAVDDAGSKAIGKARLRKAGVPTPQGIFHAGDDRSEVEAFLRQSSAGHFVVKPDIGSLARDVVTRLAKPQVLPLLENPAYAQAVVEEFIRGTEYRIHVVNGRAVSAYIKPGVFVTGNGVLTIGQLILRKNARKVEIQGLAASPINPVNATLHLRKFGKTPAMVPAMGERVELADIGNISMGGDSVGLAQDMPPDVARTAVAAARALRLPTCGIDMIHDGKTHYVLEVNAFAYLRAHSFPSDGKSAGNAVAEATIDHYFPATDGSPIRRENRPLDGSGLLEAFARDGIKTRYLLPPL